MTNNKFIRWLCHCCYLYKYQFYCNVTPTNYFYEHFFENESLKLNFRTSKLKFETNPVFFQVCLENQVLPKFLDFHMSNMHIKTSGVYYACQIKSLNEEMSFKQWRMKILEKDFNILKQKLRMTLGMIDCIHVCCLLLNKNDKKLKNQENIHSKKLKR